MEYVDYLGKDSTQLAKKLLGDIILTTESHEELFQEVQALKTALGTGFYSFFLCFLSFPV